MSRSRIDGCGEEQDVSHLMVRARPAEGTDDGDVGCAPGDGLVERELGIGRVLSRRVAEYFRHSMPKLFKAGVGDRVEVAYHDVRDDADAFKALGAPVGGNDEIGAFEGRLYPGACGELAAQYDYGLHTYMSLSELAAGPMISLLGEAAAPWIRRAAGSGCAAILRRERSSLCVVVAGMANPIPVPRTGGRVCLAARISHSTGVR